jgi:hypothetical protein
MDQCVGRSDLGPILKVNSVCKQTKELFRNQDSGKHYRSIQSAMNMLHRGIVRKTEEGKK